MQDKIIVSSNCQTAGLAAALRAMFPSYEVKPIPMPDTGNQAGVKSLTQELRSASVWVTRGRTELAEGLSVRVVTVPALYFAAFHPDLCYAVQQSTKKQTTFPYNSRILVWAYNRNVTPSDARRLFRKPVFKKLGYLEYWDRGVHGLREGFRQSGLTEEEFQRFYLKVKRIGLFMHSVNHPSAPVLVELAKLVAQRLGLAAGELKREIVIADGLTESIWPLYPEIGDALALEGNYCWRMHNREVIGLDAYVDHSYRMYMEQGIAPGDLAPQTQIPNIDAILSAELQAQ